MKLLIPDNYPNQRSIITIMFILLAPITSAAQNNLVKFNRTEATLAEAIAAIERQTEYRFVYYSTLLDVTRVIKLPLEQTTIAEVLKMLEPQIGYRTSIKLNYIIVNTAEPYRAENLVESWRKRTQDSYRKSDPKVAGTASNPRPVNRTVYDTISATPAMEPASGSRELPVAYSHHTPIDLYGPVKDRLPVAAIKTNLLYTATTYTPNGALEVGLGKHHTLEVAFSHNRWNHKAELDDNRKLMHWIIRPEYRYWFCERFNGHFIGIHSFYSGYNVSGRKVPLLFDKEYRYHGWSVGGRITYGYHWAFARKWGLEFNVGAGAAYMDYDRYDCKTCDRDSQSKSKTYFGPTRAAIGIVFMIK